MFLLVHQLTTIDKYIQTRYSQIFKQNCYFVINMIRIVLPLYHKIGNIISDTFLSSNILCFPDELNIIKLRNNN